MKATAEQEAAVVPDWYVVALDETLHYRIAPEDTPKIKAIYGVYYYNANEVTHCCEITPSYYLMHVSDEVYVDNDASDEDRERLQETYGYEGGEDCYMHCSDIDHMPVAVGKCPKAGRDRYHYGTAEYGEEEVREHVRGNNPFA